MASQHLQTGNLVVSKNKVASEGVFHHRDAGSANCAGQCQLDREPGGVTAGVEHAGAAVRCFESPRELAVVLIEIYPQAHQIADTSWPFRAKHLDGGGITQADAGAQRVGNVL